MSVWRFTGNPENWITAIGIGNWALNKHNKSLWAYKIKPGDTVIFHSTKKSDFTNKIESMVIGFGYVGSSFTEKNEHWWIQEVRDNQNYWPYVIPIKEFYLFSSTIGIDFNTRIEKKTDEQIVNEINVLTKNGIKISDLNLQAHSISQETPNFPVNGSASGINEVYERLILDQKEDFYAKNQTQETDSLEKKLAETIDDKLSVLSDKQILEQAKAFDNSKNASHSISFGNKKVRKENQMQKRRIAKLENYSCQVCGFKCEYIKTNGKPGWIIHIDHILEKSVGGNENLNNLWALCPNCHAQKTQGIIRVDLERKKVFKNGKEIAITDKHLFM